MKYNYSKLKGKVIEKFETMKNFAKAMNWSELTCSKKFNNLAEWKQSEMVKASKLLGFKLTEIPTYFFTEKTNKC